MEDYDPIDDAWKSTYEAYRAIKERMANGGPGWLPRACEEVLRELRIERGQAEPSELVLAGSRRNGRSGQE